MTRLRTSSKRVRPESGSRAIRHGRVERDTHHSDVEALLRLVEALGVREVSESVDAGEGQVGRVTELSQPWVGRVTSSDRLLSIGMGAVSERKLARRKEVQDAGKSSKHGVGVCEGKMDDG